MVHPSLLTVLPTIAVAYSTFTTKFYKGSNCSIILTVGSSDYKFVHNIAMWPNLEPIYFLQVFLGIYLITSAEFVASSSCDHMIVGISNKGIHTVVAEWTQGKCNYALVMLQF